MSTKTLNGSTPQAAEELIRKSAEMPANILAKHNIALAKTTLPEASPQQMAQPNLKVKPSGRYYESNIAQNIRNGELVVDYLITFGADYNPSNAAISVASLQAKNTEGLTFIDTVQEKKQNRKTNIDLRQDVYGNLKPLARRILNELIASGAPKSIVKAARHFVKNMQGERIIKINPDDTDTNRISASHTSFTQQVQHLSGLIGLLSTVPEYNPNISELTIAALTTKRDAMVTSNNNTGTSQAQWSTSRVGRNQFFNQEYTGYVDTYAAVKRAVKATFGNSSPQYKQISALTFVRIYS